MSGSVKYSAQCGRQYLTITLILCLVVIYPNDEAFLL